MESRMGKKSKQRCGMFPYGGSNVGAGLSHDAAEITTDENSACSTGLECSERCVHPQSILEKRLEVPGTAQVSTFHVEEDCGGIRVLTDHLRIRCCSPMLPELNCALLDDSGTRETQHGGDGDHGGVTQELFVDSENHDFAFSRTEGGETVQERWCRLLTPFPPFLISLWARQLQLQQAALDKGLLPLPLHNPSSFCFLAASLQALASLSPLLDLLHGLTYLRLLRKHLGAANSSPYLDSISVRACQNKQCDFGVSSLHDEDVQEREAADFHPTPRSRFASDLSPSGQTLRRKLVDSPRELPHILLTCFLNLNRGLYVPSLSGLRAATDVGPCKEPQSDDKDLNSLTDREQNAVKTPVDRSVLASIQSDDNETPADNYGGCGFETVEWILDSGRSAGAVSSLFDLLQTLECALGSTASLSAKTLDTAEACPDSLDEISRHEAKRNFREGRAECRRCDDTHNILTRVSEASRLSSATLERERRQILKTHQSKTTVTQHGMAAAVYREICRAAHTRFPGDVRHFGGASGSDMFMQEQDAHEFLQALLEELDEDCHCAGQLCSQLSDILEDAIANISTEDLHKTGRQTHSHTTSLRTNGRPQNTNPNRRFYTGTKDGTTACQNVLGENQKKHQTHDVRPGVDNEMVVGSTSGPSISSQQQKEILPNDRHRKATALRFARPQMRGVFSGEIAEFTRCLVCGYCAPERLVPFFCLQLSLGSAHECKFLSSPPSLQDLLRSTLGPQRVDGVECLLCSAVATLEKLQWRLRRDPFLGAARRHFNAYSRPEKAEPADFDTSRDGREGDKPLANSSGVQVQQLTPTRSKHTLGGVYEPIACGAAESVATASVDSLVSSDLDKRFPPELGVPGLFSPMWTLPATLLQGYVHRWAVVGQLKKFFALREGLIVRENLGPERGALTALQVPSQPQSSDESGISKDHGTNAKDEDGMLDAIKLYAGGFWNAVRRPKEKVQRVEQLPQVLIIQLSSLHITPYGQIYKQLGRCSFPLVFDASSLFGTASDHAKRRHGYLHCGSYSYPQTPHSKPGTLSPKSKERGMANIATTDEPRTRPVAKWQSGSVGSETNECLHKEKVNTWSKGPLYELRAVISHLGCSASTGHFVCYRRWDARTFGPGHGVRSLLEGFCANSGVRTPGASAENEGIQLQTDLGYHRNPALCKLKEEKDIRPTASGHSLSSHLSTPSAGRPNSESAPLVLKSGPDLVAESISRCIDETVRFHSACVAGREGDDLQSEEMTKSKDTGQYDKPDSHYQRDALDARNAWTKARLDTWFRRSTLLGASNASFVRVSDSCVRLVSVEEAMTTAPYLLFYQVASPAVC
ncbi:ubiquitin carboxyl-terminal hydrolase [Toxoplasma gondii TgCatPRC2]|uniref:ubiquitinyl hydrolase 1 n=2 Tax=Toxoplasma gondii TaxID=5811 RepID=A0A151HJE6_TOXGO|nr:ubiquitin carboxyl-terminal hydrolase [Toxoplasma gondii ME49]EPT27855.1 ubiquitin carboxyl-terminal hydrolase [Toxoplasma gondii ME49]KYK69440.1 ubiquitin carboxyl-terminal hydrolase [Toxoplasma gondii TgCatPRC2]|eukprot:XP_018636361.1 ubiquitin carboxyl-terminal hydrolase [Toxoplasma gondii ME49]